MTNKKQKFDWVEFHKSLHGKKYVNPKAAEIKTEAGTTRAFYSFFLETNPVRYHFDSNDELGLLLFNHMHETDKQMGVQMAEEGIAKTIKLAESQRNFLQSKFPDLTFFVEEREMDRMGEITAVYRPHNKKEADKIIDHLRSTDAALKEYENGVRYFFRYD